MRARTLRLLFRKEMLDLFRDRRTIFTMMVMPMLMMPLSLGVTNWVMTKTRQDAAAQRFRIAINDSAASHDLAAALRATGFEVTTAPDPQARAESKQAEAGITVADASAATVVTLYGDESDGIKFQVLRGRIREIVDRLRDQKLEAVLRGAGVSPDLAHAYRFDNVNLAKPQKMAGTFIGGFLAFILIMFLMNGAMYAAVDATAGEKERRTMEILLSSAAGRLEIVISKVALAALVSLMTALLSVTSMLIGFSTIKDPGKDGARMIDLPTDPATLGLIALSVLPMAVLASAVAVALATPARSAREGMSYLTPVMFLMMMLGGAAFLPMFDTNPAVAFIPIANFTMALKHIFRGDWSWSSFAATMGTNMLLAAIAVAFAVRKFQDERILLRV